MTPYNNRRQLQAGNPTPARSRYQTLDKRAAKIRKAIQEIAAAEIDWPTYASGHDQVVEALDLLGSVLRQLENSL